jgi:aryl-alcohol dehydrogenase-like predicted oxidoreductase
MTPTYSWLALGTMMFGAWGNPDEAQCREMVDVALDHGIRLFDTADIYDYGVSEEIRGRALAGRRDGVCIATKLGNPMDDDPLHRGLSARWVHEACDASLRRLGVDTIDLYQMHRPDPSTPIAETLGAMQELVDAGKVRAVGTSTFTVAELDDAWDAGPIRPAAEQPPYSILARGVEAEVLPWCAGHAVDVLVWAPLNGGWLTGKYQAETLDPAGRAVQKAEHFDHRDAAMRERKQALVGRLIGVAEQAGLTITELALGFIVSNPAVTSLLLGPRTPDQLRALLAARAEPLSRDTLAAIDAIVPPGTNVNPADSGR